MDNIAFTLENVEYLYIKYPKTIQTVLHLHFFYFVFYETTYLPTS